MPAAVAGTAAAPAGWQVLESTRHPGAVYYFCPQTNESLWTRPEAVPSSVHVRHLLLKHTASRKPHKRASDGSQVPVTRTKEEAASQLAALRVTLAADVSAFEALAKEHSDCSSA